MYVCMYVYIYIYIYIYISPGVAERATPRQLLAGPQATLPHVVCVCNLM